MVYSSFNDVIINSCLADKNVIDKIKNDYFRRIKIVCRLHSMIILYKKTCANNELNSAKMRHKNSTSQSLHSKSCLIEIIYWQTGNNVCLIFRLKIVIDYHFSFKMSRHITFFWKRQQALYLF